MNSYLNKFLLFILMSTGSLTFAKGDGPFKFDYKLQPTQSGLSGDLHLEISYQSFPATLRINRIQFENKCGKVSGKPRLLKGTWLMAGKTVKSKISYIKLTNNPCSLVIEFEAKSRKTREGITKTFTL